ncbi:PD-(D/E)XK nuclease family protein [Streptomyces sp. GSL17-111]|uniref:PD-(D/E)XK nuclease family protein n=1 Tax=Streptomyces sp. GSL17-111 TaxID=3121596 RepID=UPI0030F3B5AB
MARPQPDGCPDHRRTAVRPLLTPSAVRRRARPPLEDFGLGPLFGALDLLEHENWSLDRVLDRLETSDGVIRERGRPCHPGLVRWTMGALERYVAQRAAQQEAAERAGLPPTFPVRSAWTVRTARRAEPDARGARQYEHTVWGRRYASADGHVRELWLPSLGRAKSSRPDAELAAVAYVLTRGAPGRTTRYGAFPAPEPTPDTDLPERVRVIDFGCAEGDARLLLDCDREEAERRFATFAAPAFHEAATGIGARPGTDCVDCKAIDACTSIRRTPALWGGRPGTQTGRRSLSVSDLRAHDQCPAQYHLTRQLWLTSLQEEGEAIRRGRAVDAWLNDHHGATRRPVRGCHDLPGPADPANWTGGDHHLEGAIAREGAGMLDAHRACCPLDGLGADEQVLVQHRVAVYVPELDVVVLAVPDLLYTRSGGWVWRETKTSSSELWEGESLLRSYPQLALAVLLLNAGALGADPRRSWVEFELLHRGEATLERIDPSRPDVVAEAEGVIAGLAGPLLEDTTFPSLTGRHCHHCDARPWCGPGTAFVTERPVAQRSEVAVSTGRDDGGTDA